MIPNVIEKIITNIQPIQLESERITDHLKETFSKIKEYHAMFYLRMLGYGGFAGVALARSEELNGPVAVKVPFSKASHPLRKNFALENKLVGMCDSENVVKIYQTGETTNGGLYSIMTAGQYGDLSKFKLSFLNSFEFAKYIMLPCVSALVEIYTHNIIHRDIKPDNFFCDAEGNIYLGDFGLANTIDGLWMEEPGECKGTIDFFSPEQARSEVVDIRSDIYALGATFFYLVTNTKIYSNLPTSLQETVIELGNLKLKKRDLKSIRDDLDSEFEAIINKMVEFDKCNRYQTPSELIRHINHYIAKFE